MNERIRFMKEFKKVMKCIRYHGSVLLKGFLVMLAGTSIMALLAVSVYGFCVVPSDGGYAAVVDFLVGTVCMGVAVACLYTIGGGKKGAKK